MIEDCNGIYQLNENKCCSCHINPPHAMAALMNGWFVRNVGSSPLMIDSNRIHNELNQKVLETVQRQHDVIEQKIKEVILKFDCKPSDIVLEEYPKFTYKIKIKACEFSFDYNFKVGVEDD